MVKASHRRCVRPTDLTEPEAQMRHTLMLSSLYAVSLALLILPYGLMS